MMIPNIIVGGRTLFDLCCSGRDSGIRSEGVFAPSQLARSTADDQALRSPYFLFYPLNVKDRGVSKCIKKERLVVNLLALLRCGSRTCAKYHSTLALVMITCFEQNYNHGLTYYSADPFP